MKLLIFACLMLVARAELVLEAPEAQAVLRALAENYVERATTDFTAMDEAGLRAYVAAHPATLAWREPAAGVTHDVRSALLGQGIGWVRPASFSEAAKLAVVTAIESLREAKAHHLILDLRAPAHDVPLVAFDAWKAISRLRGETVVLVDGGTCNMGEVLAEALRTQGAIVVGTVTRGRHADFMDVPVRAGLALAMARRSVLPRPLGQGLVPDVAVALHEKAKAAVASLQTSGEVMATLDEAIRPMLNESALIAGTNPELAWRAGPPLPAPVLDTPLQVARGILRAHDLLHPAS
jgi:hypothetical protein